MPHGYPYFPFKVTHMRLLVRVYSQTRNFTMGAASAKQASSIYEFSAKDIDGNEVSMDKYRYFYTSIIGPMMVAVLIREVCQLRLRVGN